MNPKSGGGKVEKFSLVDEARSRGIEPVVLAPGDDLRTLAERAVEDGADVLGMAGGDGSQAVVASVAAAHDLAFVCVPAGTRNHLAVDLGVDRKDVVGALDAFGAAREARIDLGEVNGRIFVNNVSLGLYAEIVRRDEYRNAKAETVSTLLPELLGPRATPFDLQLQRPDGRPVTKAQMVLVSNGAYVLDRLGAIGTRPRLDSGQLGVVTLHVGGGSDATAFLALEAAGQARRFPGWSEWVARSLVIASGARVPAGIDGESVVLDAPLRFTIRPSALRVRTALFHPGLSPAAKALTMGRATFVDLVRILRGRPSGLFR
jgi:diacylglycerol kinase family enzyme